MTSPGNGLKVYVVSLTRATVRRKAILEQLSRQGIDFVFVDAVDATQVGSEYLRSQVDEAAVMRNIGRRLSEPEIGCALSHRSAYSAIVDRKEYGAVIIEDDVSITDKFTDMLSYFFENGRSISQESRIYHLGTIGCAYARDAMVRRRTRVRYRDSLSFVALVPNWSSVWGTYGYYITQEAASKLLTVTRIGAVADGWGIFYRDGLIKDIYISVPSVVVHTADFADGHIEHQRQEMMTAYAMKGRRRESFIRRAVKQTIRNHLVRPFVERIL